MWHWLCYHLCVCVTVVWHNQLFFTIFYYNFSCIKFALCETIKLFLWSDLCQHTVRCIIFLLIHLREWLLKLCSVVVTKRCCFTTNIFEQLQSGTGCMLILQYLSQYIFTIAVLYVLRVVLQYFLIHIFTTLSCSTFVDRSIKITHFLPRLTIKLTA